MAAGLMDQALNDGYTVISGPFDADELRDVVTACDLAMEGAHPNEIKIGANCIRVTGILRRAPLLTSLLLHEPLLAAAERVIGGPFKLSAFNARKVRPGAAA